MNVSSGCPEDKSRNEGTGFPSVPLTRMLPYSACSGRMTLTGSCLGNPEVLMTLALIVPSPALWLAE